MYMYVTEENKNKKSIPQAIGYSDAALGSRSGRLYVLYLTIEIASNANCLQFRSDILYWIQPINVCVILKVHYTCQVIINDTHSHVYTYTNVPWRAR